jgi:predicted secreted protein
VTLEAGVQREVNLDVMQAVLSVEADDNNLARLADTMRQKLEWGVRLARESPYIEVEVREYRTYPIYDRYDPYRFSHWWATQEVLLKSKDFAALNRVLGNLQGKLLVRSVTFTLSPEAQREAENGLLDEALRAFKDRAQLVQKGLNAANYRILTLEIHLPPLGSPQPGSPPLGSPQAGFPRGQPPRAYAGTELASVSLIGSIELK